MNRSCCLRRSYILQIIKYELTWFTCQKLITRIATSESLYELVTGRVKFFCPRFTVLETGV